MEAVFLKLVNLSITATWLILGAIALRLLFKKAPKYLRFIAWVLVGVRLLIPISFESALSLIPSAEPIPQEILTSASPQIQSGINAVNQFVNPIISETLAPAVPSVESSAPAVQAVTPIQTLTHIASTVWICGMVLMLGYALVSYIVLRRRVSASVRNEYGAYICDDINSPFVFGIIRPRIYMPSSLTGKQMEHVAAHERAHIKRRDHWWKPLAFVLLSVYWFNPVIWVAYILLCRDIELACDERVARSMDDDEKVAYSNSLLDLSIPRKMIAACPVAFGEVGVKDRIKSVLSYKKPTLWIIIAAVAACAVLAITLLTDPVEKDEEKDEPKQSDKADEGDENEALETFPEWDQKYAAVTSKDAIVSYFCLDEETEAYMFVYSGLSSHISMGSYEFIENDLILLEEDTEKEYIFRATEDGYTFDASRSAALPEYKYSADSEPEVCIEDGALFVIKEVEAEPYTVEGEYWIIERSGNGDYGYTILDENKNSLLTCMIAPSEPTISYLGNGIVKISFNVGPSYTLTSSTYVNIKTAEQSGEMYSVVGENANNGIVVYQYNTDSVVVRDMFDSDKLYYRTLLPDVSNIADGITSCVINDDGTVNLSYISADGNIKDIVIDKSSSHDPELLYSGDGVELYCVDTLNSVYTFNKEFILKYNGKEQLFTGIYNMQYDALTVYVEDLTGDGNPEITVTMPYGQGMGGGCHMDVHVFNSVDLSRYSFVPISDIIAKNVGLSSDENAFYIELNGEKYKFDRGDLIDPEFEIDTQNWNQYTVSDGKLHCETYCFIVNPVYTFAVILTEYSFDGEEFVLDNISLVPADEYLIKNETPSAEQNDTSASNIPAASPSRAPETSSGTNTNTNTNTKSPSSSALENNAVSDSSISVTSPIAGKPQPTPYDQRPKDRSEQNNTAGSGSEDGIFMNENISENLAHEISQRYAEAAENNKTTEVLSGPDESGPNESIVWDYDVRP